MRRLIEGALEARHQGASQGSRALFQGSRSAGATALKAQGSRLEE